MRYLLDTHTFIWLDTEPDRLSRKTAEILTSDDNVLLLSLVSVWEMQIKLQLGKLELPLPLDDMVKD